MHTVLGLSLNSHDVAWVLVDADGTVLDHDALELHADTEIALASARSAQVISRACGLEVDRVRLTWTDDVACEGFRLRTRLDCLGLGEIEAVPMACAASVSVDPEVAGISARLALAYGAALAEVGPREEITVPVMQQIRTNSRLPRQRIASAVVGVAAAALLGVLFLSAGAAPRLDRPATTAEGSASSDTGWATVPAASDIAATLVRKVVDTPSYAKQSPHVPERAYPVPVVAATAPEPVHVVAATAPEPMLAATGSPHLSDALPVTPTTTGLAEPAALPAPGPEMTDPEPGTTMPDMTEIVKALSALP